MFMPVQCPRGKSDRTDDPTSAWKSDDFPAGNPSDPTVLAWVVGFYCRTFAADPAATDFLQEQTCFHADALKVLRIGYANRTLGAALSLTREGRALKPRLQSLGVFRADTGHEHLNGCLIWGDVGQAPFKEV